MRDIFLKKGLVLIITFLLLSINLSMLSKNITVEGEIISEISNNDCLEINALYDKETLMVEMRDGVKLATDIYTPYAESPSNGAILVRTPYNKDGMSDLSDWADSGWPTVVQDMRGRFASEGIDTVFRNAHTDGPDTLEWMSEQTWCNGKIATFGGSALGINQYYMAGANPENLACQFIGVATPDLYNHAMYQGGEFRKGMVEGWLEGQGSTFVLPELWENENYSMDYWTNVSLQDNWNEVNVPAIHLGGWYDCFCQGTIDGFMGYQYFGGSGAKGKSKLIMGPWTHGTFGTRFQGELIYPSNAKDTFSFDMFVEMLDQHILEISNQYQNRPNVSYYVMGDVDDPYAPGNEWRYTDFWPPLSVEEEWYFHEDSSLSKTKEVDASLSYSYDPMDPVPTIGGQNLNLPAGPRDQRAIENRDDVLVFTTPVLEEPYEASGPIKARLYVSSNCLDTDFTVKLSDVYPDGRSMIITDGILKMRYRNGCGHWDFMEPGEIYEIIIDMWSTSYVWNTGHQIRVVVSSSNYPRFLNNPNTADAIYENETHLIAKNTLYLGDDYPSSIILPKISDNYSPSKPIIEGPSSGLLDTPYDFSFSSIDPEGDQIFYYIDWGDDQIENWIGPYDSGEIITLNHSWLDGKLFTIRAKTKDTNGAESDWGMQTVIIPKNKMISNFILALIQGFPMLSKLINCICYGGIKK